jgi:hypothetical protein
MDFDSEIIDISNSYGENNNKNKSSYNFKSTNFGSGIELLMNDNLKDSSSSSKDIGIGELEELENELKEMSLDNNSNPFAFEPSFKDSTPISIGQSTAEASSSFKEPNTWDGFGKFSQNNLPGNPDMFPEPNAMTKEELLREKFKYLKKLEALEKKGIELTKKYSMDSSLSEMQGEYETIRDEESKKKAIQFQGQMMMACINGIEFLNSKFDPFDIKLDGWSDQVNENIGEYDSIFEELHEKYKSKATMAPELKLLFQLGGSAMMVHMSNTLFKSALPGMDDIMRQNPDLAQQFQKAAIDSMGQSNPGLSGFMNNVMNNTSQPQQPTNSYQQPLPPYQRQPAQQSQPRRMNGAGLAKSNDINIAMTRPSFSEKDDKDINYKQTAPKPMQAQPMQRSEMKGPSDISDILSGLKTKTININQTSNPSFNETQTFEEPKKSKRRTKSDKNTVSIDL